MTHLFFASSHLIFVLASKDTSCVSYMDFMFTPQKYILDIIFNFTT